MNPILFASVTEGTVPTSHGLGNLSSCISAEVVEERNGAYELTLVYPADGIHAEELQPDRFILAKPNYTDNPQLFRVYKIGKVMDGRFTVKAQHIAYDLSGKIITSGTAGSATAACLLLQAQAGAFTITTDKNVSAPFSVSVPSWFGGKQGSLLDIYGPAEWKYDNYTCSLLANRGADRGVKISYGKNLTQLSQELSIENLATGIVPYYVDSDGVVTTGTKVSTGLVSDVPKDRAIDFSSDVDPESATPILTQLATLANNYIANNNLLTGLNSITLDFVQLGELSERVDLCDTVHIYFDALGITASAKCITTRWDVLKERYSSASFGDPRVNIAETLTTVARTLRETPTKTDMGKAIEHATELITGNLGGYVVLHDANSDGEPDELLIMNTDNINTATKVWRFGLGGLGFSPNGYAGPYDVLALTMDGEIVADAITTGTLNANLIKAGTIEDVAGHSQIDMTSGTAKLWKLKATHSLRVADADTDDELAEIWASTNGAAFEMMNRNGVQSILLAIGGNNDGYLDLKDGNGNVTVSLSGAEGRLKAKNAFEELSFNQLSTVGAQESFSTNFSGLLIVGKVRASGSRSTTIIPLKMLDSTPVRYYLSDETNYISFNASITDGTVTLEIAAKSSDGFIEKVYGMF